MAHVHHFKPAPPKPPTHLDRVPKSPEELIAIGAEIVGDYMLTDSEMTDREFVSLMLQLFDNPTAIEAYDREMERRAGGRDVDQWN